MINPEHSYDIFASIYLRYKRKIDIGLALFFFIAAWGIAIPRSQVMDLIPIAFYLVALFILLTHFRKNALFLFKFFLLILAGWAIEVMGVQGGILFGRYGYGDLFGSAILKVPLVCGVIWLTNTLMMMQISRHILGIQGFWKTALLAALLMTALDAFAQLPACKIGFWSYKDASYPPFYHSMGYFGISLLTCTFGGDDFVNHKNPGAIAIAFIETTFLIVLYVLTLLFR